MFPSLGMRRSDDVHPLITKRIRSPPVTRQRGKMETLHAQLDDVEDERTDGCILIRSTIVDECRMHDPIFAKRYEQLKSAVRVGRAPLYDPGDCKIRPTVSKSKIRRIQESFIATKECRMKETYQNEQIRRQARFQQRMQNFFQCVDQLTDETA
jgi:hypothetical protein